jgi:hypothetical protein
MMKYDKLPLLIYNQKCAFFDEEPKWISHLELQQNNSSVSDMGINPHWVDFNMNIIKCAGMEVKPKTVKLEKQI